MSRRVSVSYTVPAQVTVDLDTGHVDQVRVIADGITADPGAWCVELDDKRNPTR